MANHKDAIKRDKQNQKARLRNRHYRSLMRNRIKALREAVKSGDSQAAAEQLRKTVSVIQRVAQKGVIHKRQAARRVSRLAAAVGELSQNG